MRIGGGLSPFYVVDCVIVGFNFSMMGYLNGMGHTGFVALQGILSTFLVRIPVSWLMSRLPDVTLFQVGFATPLATVFAIDITVIYIYRLRRASANDGVRIFKRYLLNLRIWW